MCGADSDAGVAEASSEPEPVPTGACGASASMSAMGFDPIAGATGELYNPNGDESFLVTGTRGMGEMGSPIDIAGGVSFAYSLATDPACQEAVADAWRAVIDYFSGWSDSAQEQPDNTHDLFYNTDLD